MRLSKLSKEARDDIIEIYYKKLKSANEVSRQLGLNNRTVFRALKKRGYDLSKAPKLIIKPVKVTNLETNKTIKFRSQTQCAKYFYEKDLESRRELLGDPKTFKDGLDFKIYSLTHYRIKVADSIKSGILYRNHQIENI